MRPFRIVILILAVALLRAEDGDFPMRWRVFCDVASSDAFHYPYDYAPVDQFKGDLRHLIMRRVRTDQQPVVITTTEDDLAMLPDIHHFSYLNTDLVKQGMTSLSSVGDKESVAPLTWSTYDYYAKSAERPFADPKWADAGIEAMVGESAKQCGMVVRHGTQVSGIILKGGRTSGDNDRILNSFEVLVLANGSRSGKVVKLAKGEKPGKRTRPVDWTEAHCLERVLGADGILVKPATGDAPVEWSKGWEVETQHYHITTDFTPDRLLEHALYVEALFRAYNATYQPDFMPPYKFEVHIFNTYREFLKASAEHGNAIPSRPGEIVGGFFVPELLSLWVYEESGALGGESFSIEHVMAHECSHQFLHVTCNGSDHIPTWINEGLAVYFEPGKFVNGEFQIGTPTERLDRLKNIYQQTGKTLVPLTDYLDHHSFIPADCYGEVYAMTMFWIFGTSDSVELNPKHNPGYRRFLEYMTALRHHEDGAKAFERIFMVDMVKAQGGSREKAINVWQEELLDYAKTLR